MDNSKRTLALFFTQGISVKQWISRGLLPREKIVYEELLKLGAFGRIIWFSYGVFDKQYESILSEGITIVPKPLYLAGWLGGLMYSLLLPVLRRRIIRSCTILKTNQIWGSWTAVFCKLCYGKKLVVRSGFVESLFAIHRHDRRLFYRRRRIERFTFNRADSVVVSAPADRLYLQETYPQVSVTWIPNYIDDDLFSPADIRKTVDIVFVGRLVEQKNIYRLIEAVFATDYSLNIYGSGYKESQLRRLICDLGLTERVRLKGVVANDLLPGALRESRLYVLPSLYEGMPKTLLEAMSCGCCCLGSDQPGIREVIRHGHNGWLCGVDAESIRAAFERLLPDEPLRRRLGHNARCDAVNHFSLNRVLDLERKIYSAWLSGNGTKFS